MCGRGANGLDDVPLDSDDRHPSRTNPTYRGCGEMALKGKDSIEFAAEENYPTSNEVHLAEPEEDPPAGAVAAALYLESERHNDLIHIACSERGADEIAQALTRFLPRTDILLLPPWDCLPYDRVWPTRETMGQRLAVLNAIANPPGRPRITVTSVEAAVQRVPPRHVISPAFTTLELGKTLGLKAFQESLQRFGYFLDDRVDEPGEFALRGSIIDIFPAGDSLPLRIVLDPRQSIAELKTYDPVSQLSEQSLTRALIGPASELILGAGDDVEAGDVRPVPIEERLVSIYGEMPTLFDTAPGATVSLQSGVDFLPLNRTLQIIEDARLAKQETSKAAKPCAEKFYLSREGWIEALRGRKCVRVTARGGRVPRFFRGARPGYEFTEFVKTQQSSGATVLITGQTAELERAGRLLERKFTTRAARVTDWTQVLAAPTGCLLEAEFDLDEGFVAPQSNIVVIATADIFGSVSKTVARPDPGMLEAELQIGDAVVHEGHGLGKLAAIERTDLAGQGQDVVRLEYRDGASLLVPVDEFGRIWRYGSEPDSVRMDRLDGDDWSKRQQSVMREIKKLAKRLVARARARSEQPAEIIKPKRADLARFNARFPHRETRDQTKAIAAVLQDLSSGKAMNRLICGDVGFGKTEVALRACAAAALCGKQVAVVAPTTVLARQHFETFRGRFAEMGIQVAHLSRVVGAAEAAKVKEGLRSGAIRIVVGTQAILSKSVAIANLGLLVIDEEHRFGVKMKQALRDLAPGIHTLTMSATPIPRTLQSALSGVQDVSTLRTPPAKRRPIRTLLAPFDATSVRSAVLREYRRGGQTFFVVPRIEDIEPIAEKLNRLVPTLSVKTAHGEMNGSELDDIVVSFAAGEGEVLVSTDIIESGLDVPRANTIIIWRPDLFGLAQLHQLRGRVGRGRTQGIAFLLTEPGRDLPEGTKARLATLVALDRLGSGLAISQRDLDLRGAGDLFGEEQAGHVKLIGAALYEQMLKRALAIAGGRPDPDKQIAEISINSKGSFPNDYVPDASVRLSLYARLSRIRSQADLDAFRDELEDRFGAIPGEVKILVDLADLRICAAELGVSKIDVGPEAIAVAFRAKAAAALWRDRKVPRGCQLRGGRLICKRSLLPMSSQTQAIRVMLDMLHQSVA